MIIQTINPATEEIINTYSLFDITKINNLIDAAHDSYKSWQKESINTRKTLMLNLIKLLKERKGQYVQIMSTEMGKPIHEGVAEIDKCIYVCEYFASNAEDFLKPKIYNLENKRSTVCYQPLGVVFAIMPWNFPFWQVFRFAAPTIMAGNAAILKHAPITTGSGIAIAELFKDAGFPPNLFQHFILDNELASYVISHEKISAVTLTGSEQAGSAVAAAAGKYLKKSVLELGGNDPYIILKDADLTKAAVSIVSSRLNNCGQVCIAAKRIIAVNEVIDELTKKIIKLSNNYKIGNPLDLNTTIGPMARDDLRIKLHDQVLSSIANGAKLLKGGKIPKGRGFYYPITILANVSPGMQAFDDELFGPVFSIINAKNEDDAIKLANQSRYGLGASIFTKDALRGEQIAINDIEVGTCYVNGMVASDPNLPFGGIKCSGFGRELSREGILEFINIKTISVIV